MLKRTDSTMESSFQKWLTGCFDCIIIFRNIPQLEFFKTQIKFVSFHHAWYLTACFITNLITSVGDVFQNGKQFSCWQSEQVKVDMAELSYWSWSTQYLVGSLGQWDKEIAIGKFTICGHWARVSSYASNKWGKIEDAQ